MSKSNIKPYKVHVMTMGGYYYYRTRFGPIYYVYIYHLSGKRRRRVARIVIRHIVQNSNGGEACASPA